MKWMHFKDELKIYRVFSCPEQHHIWASQSVWKCFLEMVVIGQTSYIMTQFCLFTIQLHNILRIIYFWFHSSLQIRIKDMEKFQFPGSKDLAAMFEFYQSGQAVRDIKLTRKLNPHALTFDRWLSENRDKVEEALREAN